MKRVLKHMLDETKFLSPGGIRALSREHAEKPYIFRVGGEEFRVDYEPGDSRTGIFGGNSNWRGPVWMPVNYLIIESLQKFHHYFSDDFLVEYPTGSGHMMTLWDISMELSRRLTGIFTRTPRDGAWSTATARPSRRTRTGATTSSFMNTSTATPARDSAPATRPAGPRSWPSCSSSKANTAPGRASARSARTQAVSTRCLNLSPLVSPRGPARFAGHGNPPRISRSHAARAPERRAHDHPLLRSRHARTPRRSAGDERRRGPGARRTGAARPGPPGKRPASPSGAACSGSCSNTCSTMPTSSAT